jgi:hypothetical protein
MAIQSPGMKETLQVRRLSSYRQFVLGFFALLAIGVASFGIMLCAQPSRHAAAAAADCDFLHR